MDIPVDPNIQSAIECILGALAVLLVHLTTEERPRGRKTPRRGGPA